MFLSLDQIRRITFGALDVTISADGYYIFHRMTKNIYAAYSPSVGDSLKCAATSGVKFDFFTDSQFFNFSFRVKSGSSRNFYYFDIYTDGVMTGHYGEREMWIMKGEVKTTLPGGRHRVTVYMPCLASAELNNVELADGSEITPADRKLKMLCVGDSITQGYDAEYPSLCYANLVADEFGANMVNQAIGGDRFHPEHLDAEMNFEPDIVTVAYGTNDWSGSLKENFDSDMPRYFEKLAKMCPHAKIFVITPLWRADGNRVTKVGTFEGAVAQIAAEASRYSNMTVIDGSKLTPRISAFYSDLKLHPNDIGFVIYAKNLITELKKYF